MRWFAKARKTDPVTSHEAAASVKNPTELQNRILAILASHGAMNDVELCAIHDYMVAKAGVSAASDSSIRSRRSELVALGLVADSGDRVKMPSGRRSIVWAVTAEGEKVFAGFTAEGKGK